MIHAKQQDKTIQSLNETIQSLTSQLEQLKKQSTLEEGSTLDCKHQEKVLFYSLCTCVTKWGIIS